VNAQALWCEDRAAVIVEEHRHLRGALLPILHAFQEEFGCIDDAAIPFLARELNLSRADVHGVVSFYHDFRRSRPGRHTVKVCRAEACQSMGCNDLVSHIENRLSVRLGETTPDDAFTIEAVFCLGNCALAPAVMVDKRLYGRVDTRRLDIILGATLAAEAAR
jgi:formate dehydrogenase subunit gamma